jgi:4-hydroxy-2-oxoheptanedioate aldolase
MTASASTALLNTFKAKKPAFGAWLTLPGTFHARAVAQSTPHLSWIAVDCEHGLVPLQPGAAETIHAISSTRYAPSAVVRVPATGVSASTSWQIKYALDAGAQGVIVPLVSTVEKAEEVVLDAKFPPMGRRGFGNPFTHDVWQQKALDYINTANENTLVMVQIENRQAVGNAKDIASVNGIGESS